MVWKTTKPAAGAEFGLFHVDFTYYDEGTAQCVKITRRIAVLVEQWTDMHMKPVILHSIDLI